MAKIKLNSTDASFIQMETRETMMHVAGLMYFSPGEGQSAIEVSEAFRDLKDTAKFYSPWTYRLAHPEKLGRLSHYWIDDTDVDLEYHVRRSALAHPNDERELGILISRLHSNPIDFGRPPWEIHLVEGLPGGRVAMYVKMHHSLVDGVSGMRLLERSLSTDPNDLNTPPFFAQPQPSSFRDNSDLEAAPPFTNLLGDSLKIIRGRMGTGREVGKAMATTLKAAMRQDDSLVVPFKAPMSILNGRVGRARRFATQQYPLDQLKRIAKAVDGTLNDVVVAICAGGIRRFLLELNELPEQPMTAMLPVSLRPKDDQQMGNAVGFLVATLGTDIADPEKRLRAIMESTKRSKEHLQSMSKKAIERYGMLVMMPYVVQMLTGRTGRARPPFNVTISNIPGPQHPLYFRGAQMDATFPVSIATHSQGFNITCQSYNGYLNFGFLGCRDSVPHMQKIAVYCGDALEELEQIAGL